MRVKDGQADFQEENMSFQDFPSKLMDEIKKSISNRKSSGTIG